MTEIRFSPARAITRLPGHHFFGYYGIPPWNASERLYACLESDFHERPPAAGERATIGVVDLDTELDTERFRPLTTTAAWNLQQGAMLHWLPTAPETHLIFNDLDEAAGCFRPVILDVPGGTRRTVPSPVGIGAVSPDGRSALGLDYGRLHHQRPVVGYAGGRDRTAGVLAPDDDGVWHIDLESGRATLIVSHAQAMACAPPPPLGHQRAVFFNHTLYNPAGTRCLCFLRYFDEHGQLDSAVFTAGADGSALRCIVPWGQRVSHFDWISADTVLVTVRHPSGRGRQYALIRDLAEEGWATRTALGEGVLVSEGHPSFSPDRRWFVFDTGPDDERLQTLRLYDLADNRIVILGRYHAAPHVRGDWRCDLHPRWNRSGTQVSFDSVHTGDRQVYVVDVTPDG
ncbi:MAG: hypothetical protein M3442_10710 [Chloroflexota bacterium]|nr:hypothetical protein [Chloroflexota bacterium]